MKKTISVVVADSSEDYRKMLSEYIDAEEDMYVAATVENGAEAAERVHALRPDVLITDLLLREMEGLVLIRKLKEKSVLPHTIVVSGFFNDRLAEMAGELGVERFLPKPCRVASLTECIRDCTRGDVSEGEDSPRCQRLRRAETERLAGETLKMCGVMPHLSGYDYLLEALLRIVDDSGKLIGVTKVLYPELAKHFSTSPSSVERCIRNALDLAWKDGRLKNCGELLGADHGGTMKRRPGNVRFLKLAHEYIARRLAEGSK